MNVNINNKWAAAIVFVLLGIFTMLVPTDEEDKKDGEETTKETTEQKTEEKKDSVVVNPVLDTDPYQELDDLIICRKKLLKLNNEETK